MNIYKTDNEKVKCNCVEISTDGTTIIADEIQTIPVSEVIRIVNEREPKPTRADILGWIKEQGEYIWADFLEHFDIEEEYL